MPRLVRMSAAPSMTESPMARIGMICPSSVVVAVPGIDVCPGTVVPSKFWTTSSFSLMLSAIFPSPVPNARLPKANTGITAATTKPATTWRLRSRSASLRGERSVRTHSPNAPERTGISINRYETSVMISVIAKRTTNSSTER